MPLNVYSPCPGGTGKKIKFCCPDLLPELERIDRMVDGDQFQACLEHIERLERTHPDRACLLGTKCQLLRWLDRWEEAEATATRFLQRYPENPVALAAIAIVIARREGGPAAMRFAERSLAACSGQMFHQVYEMLMILGQVLLNEGHYAAAYALFQRAALADDQDPSPRRFLNSIRLDEDIPVWVKQAWQFTACPEGVPWRTEFDEAVALARRGHYAAAEQRLLALASTVGDQPVIWRNMATLRAWRADDAGAIEALRKYAALDVPLEDGVEAEAVAMFLSDDPLGDSIDVLSLTYEIDDVERFQASVARSDRFHQIPFDPTGFTEEGQVPPLAVFVVFDRPLPRPGTELTLDDVASAVCRGLFFGKQTDRPARFELVPVANGDLETLQRILGDSIEGLGQLVQREVTEKTSQTRGLLARNWPLPEGTSAEQIERLIAQHEERVLLERWPCLPLGILDGKTPQSAASEPACRVRLLAAILLMEFWGEISGGKFDFNRLRARLGLPTLEPIDPEQTDPSSLPPSRLHRLRIEKLSNEAVLEAFLRALAIFAVPALRKLGPALIKQPDFSDPIGRMEVCALLVPIEKDPQQALWYVEEGRKTAEASGRSSAHWDLLELSVRYREGEPDEVVRLWEHLTSAHIREPGVASALNRWLVRIGAIRPDGTPVQSPASRQYEPAVAVPTQPGAEPGKLWVPGGQEPGAEKPKLWTPGNP